MRWLAKLFSRDTPPPSPVLLRVAEAGARPSDVDVECIWYPSGRTASRRHRTAAGLCVIPWYGDEERVRVLVRTHSGSGALELDRDRLDQGRVLEVNLAS